MADRYWVGGAGTWSNSSTTNWAATSGGTSGASVPTNADDVFFDANSGTTPFSVTQATTATLNCRSLNISVGNITMTGGAGITLQVFGNLSLHSNTTWSATSSTTFTTNLSQTQLNANGVTFNGPINITAATFQQINLAANLATVSTSDIRLEGANNGTFNGNGFWFTGGNRVVTLTSVGNCILNNVRSTIEYQQLNSLTNSITTTGGTWEVPNYLYGGQWNLTFSTDSNITIGNNFRITDTTNRTMSVGANTRIRTGASASSGSNIFVANAASNLTISRGTNSAVVLAYNGTSGQSVNVYGFSSGFLTANTLNFLIPNGSHTINFVTNFRTFDTNFAGFSGTANLGASLRPAGNLTLSNTMTIANGSASNLIVFDSTGVVQRFNTNGLTVPCPVLVTGFLTLDSNVTLTANNSTLGNFTLGTSNSCNFNGYNLECSLLRSTTSSFNMDFPTPSNIWVNNSTGGTILDFSSTSTLGGSPSNCTLNFNMYGSNAANIVTGSQTGGFRAMKFSSGTGNLTIQRSVAAGEAFLPAIDFTGFSGNLITTNGNTWINGNILLSPTMTIGAGSNNQWNLSFGSQYTRPSYINTNGVTITRDIDINDDWTLQSNLVQIGSFFQRGTSSDVDLNNFSWTTNSWTTNTLASSMSVNFGTAGTGQVVITGASSGASFATYLSYTTGVTLIGNVRFIMTNTTATGGGRRIFTGNATAANTGNRLLNIAVNNSSANINILSGATDTINLEGNCRNLNLTGMTSNISFFDQYYVYGNLTIPATGGNFVGLANALNVAANAGLQGATNIVDIDTGNRLLDFPLNLRADTGSGLTSNGCARLLSNLNVATTANAGTRGLFVITNPLDLNGFTITTGNFNMNGATTARSIAFNGGTIVFNTPTTSNFIIANTSNFSVTGNAQVFVSGSAAFTRTITVGGQCGEANLLSFTINTTAGVANLTTAFRDLTINASGTTISTGILGPEIYGNYTYRAGTLPTGTFSWNLYSSNAVNIDTNNVAHDFNWRTWGNGTYTLANNIIAGPNTSAATRWFDMQQGTVNLNGRAIFAGNMSIGSTSAKSLNFTSGGNITLNSTGGFLDFSGPANPNFSYTGNLQIYSNTSGASGGTRSINCGNIAESGTFNISADTAANSLRIGNNYADTVTIAGNILGLNLTGWSGNRVNWGNNTCNFHGDINLPASGGNLVGVGNQWNFTSTNATARTINVNNRATDWPWNFNGVGGTWTLAGNLTIGPNSTGGTRSLILAGGNLNLNNNFIFANFLNATGTSNRTLSFGTTGQVNLHGSNLTIVNIPTATEFRLSGTPRVVLTNSTGTGTRTIAIGNVAPTTTGGVANANNMFDFNINGGTGIVFIQGTTDDINYIGDANNFSLANLTRTLFNGNREIYGNFTVPATGGTINGGTNFTNIRGFSGTYTIATANRALDFPMTFNGNGNYIISENLVVGVNTVSSTRTLTLTAGNMSISNGVGVHSANFFSSSTSPRNINFAGTNSRLKLLANNTTLWNSNIGTNFSYSGTPYIESIYTATAAATRTMDFGSIPEAFTFDIVVPINTPGFAINTANDFCNITGNVRDFNISAYTGTVTNATRNIHGNLTIPASNGTYATGTAVTSFTATSGTRTIDTANRTLQFPFTFNGPGGTFVLNSNIVANTTTVLTLANGTVDFRQRDANTWANITIAGGATGNVAIQNLVSNRNFVHNSGCLITQSGAVNSSTTGTYTMNNANCTLNVSASFSTAAFTHTAGNIIL